MFIFIIIIAIISSLRIFRRRLLVEFPLTKRRHREPQRSPHHHPPRPRQHVQLSLGGERDGILMTVITIILTILTMWIYMTAMVREVAYCQYY